MWQIDINKILSKSMSNPWIDKLNKSPKDFKPVSPKDLAREKESCIKAKVNDWVLKLNLLLRSGYRKYDTTPTALPNDVLERINSIYREAGWKVCIIRHDNMLTLEFSEA